MHASVPAEFTEGSSALLVTAVHAGSAMRDTLAGICALSEGQRLREEDPFTDQWTSISDNRIVGLRSRFEMDLNRPRDKAVYKVPSDCWGLVPWVGDLPQLELQRSLATYDVFYERTAQLVEAMSARHARVVVYDLHSYNHQRAGEGIMDDPAGAPEINLGTAHVDVATWGPVLDVLVASLKKGPDGREHDVRANVKFKGGHFSYWLSQRFGSAICPVAIEFKKTFMNEWTGEPNVEAIEGIRALLAASIRPVMQATKALPHG